MDAWNFTAPLWWVEWGEEGSGTHRDGLESIPCVSAYINGGAQIPRMVSKR